MIRTTKRLATAFWPILWGRRSREFLGREDGTAAVEFALIAAPFFALLMAIIETGFVFIAQQSLQTATSQAARLIMTGQAQIQAITAAQFQTDVCANVTTLNCANLYVNVQKFASFSTVSPLNPLVAGNFNSAAMSYSLGNPGDIMLVQVFYQLPVVVAPLGFNISNMNGSKRLLVATAVFRTEPY